MNAKRILIKLVALALCVVSLAACFSASAAEITLDCTYFKITKECFVADTFNGVQARYNLYGRRLYCTELVERYYKQLYDLDVTCHGRNGLKIHNSDDYRFCKVTVPQPGNVMFAAARDRGTSYNHWAICKEVDYEKGTITVFEQNWRWNGMAGVGRTIPLKGNCYVYYDLVEVAPAVDHTA